MSEEKQQLPRFSLDVSRSIVFCVVLVVVGVLVGLGKIDQSYLKDVFFILIPSPLRDEKEQRQ